MESNQKEFIIPCIWQVSGEMRVKATSLEEAVQLAKDDEALPTDGEYIDGSFVVDEDSHRFGEIV